MKNKKEIGEQIRRSKILRRNMPHYSMFGTDNWKNIDIEIATLEKLVDKNDNEVEAFLDNRLDMLGLEGEDWLEDSICRVCDWLLGNVEDDLVTEEDLELWGDNK